MKLILEINWNPKVLQKHGFWNRKENQRHFLEHLERKLGISNPKDWTKVSLHTFNENGGGRLLKIYGSLRNTLQNVFPGCLSK